MSGSQLFWLVIVAVNLFSMLRVVPPLMDQLTQYEPWTRGDKWVFLLGVTGVLVPGAMFVFALVQVSRT